MHQTPQRILHLSLLAVACSLATSLARAEESTIYIGTYTRGTKSKGIYVYQFDDSTGELQPLSIAEGVENPSFLAVHPSQRFLYSSDEVDVFGDEPQGAVSAWVIDEVTGELRLLNRQGAGGTSPCHLTVDSAGRRLLAVGYGSGTVAVLPIAESGKLLPLDTLIKHHGSSVNAERQSSPHPHQVVIDASGSYAFVPDLGLDQIVVYQYDPNIGRRHLVDPRVAKTAPGAGPRHIVFAPNGSYAYCINELDLTISAYFYDAKLGELRPRKTISAIADEADRTGVSGAEIALHPNGKFLYASLRGTDEIVVYRVALDTGELEFLQRIPTGGQTPRNFALDPTGKWLLAANQNSGTIRVFGVGDDGRLTATAEHADVPSPVCLLFLKR